jgi:hypothetical protein
VTALPLGERLRRRFRRRVIAPLEERVGAALRRRRNAHREFRPLFVTGAMGSGTTLLAFSLGQRFDVACVVPESAHQVDRGSFLHVAGVDDFPSVGAYEAAIQPRPGWSPAAGRADLLALYRGFASGPSDRPVDKGPNTNLVRAAFLAECFPEGHFLCVFRDPVANVEGFRRKWRTFGRDPLEESIRFYAAIHERFLAESPAFGDRVTWIEYERLVERPDALLDLLAARLGLAPARRPRRLPRRGNVPGQGIRNVARSRIGVVRDANDEALARLAPAEAARIRAALEPLCLRMRALALAP